MKKIGIFCGGFSSEFEISMKSGRTILNHFPRGYQPYLIEVKKEQWTVFFEEKRYTFDREKLGFFMEDVFVQLDAALIYIHGNPGEDGKLQAYFDMKGMPYINSGALASELSFDKWYCNQFLRGFGFQVASSILLRSPEQHTVEEIVNQLGLPCFVKPADSGSSYGISKVNEISEVKPALLKAFKEGGTIVVEAGLKGIEVTCGVYRNQTEIVALPLTEIVSKKEFFDYDAKYLGQSEEITPARISEELTAKTQEISKRIYDLLNLKSLARIDYMLVGNIPYVIEVNTTPGFSAESIVPKMLRCAEKSIQEFWEEIFAVEMP